MIGEVATNSVTVLFNLVVTKLLTQVVYLKLLTKIYLFCFLFMLQAEHGKSSETHLILSIAANNYLPTLLIRI